MALPFAYNFTLGSRNSILIWYSGIYALLSCSSADAALAYAKLIQHLAAYKGYRGQDYCHTVPKVLF